MKTKWEYQHITLDPGDSHYDILRINGDRGWEAWHMEVNRFRTIYFKRQKTES